MGKIRHPQYRIVVADSRTKRDGRAIEFLGIYHPKEDPSRIEVNSDRVQHWLSVGAQPSEPVRAILSKTGDWQKFKGLPAPPPLLVAPEKADRKAAYEAEAKAAVGVVDAPAAKPRKSAEKRHAAEAAPAAAAPAPAAPAPAPVAPAAVVPVAPAAAAPAAEVVVATQEQTGAGA
jgi:small subunit ribosomal protein S16